MVKMEERWQNCQKKAEEFLKVENLRKEFPLFVQQALLDKGIDGKVKNIKTIPDYPYIMVEVEIDWGGLDFMKYPNGAMTDGYLPVIIGLDEDDRPHDPSFGSKNRLDLSQIQAKALELLEQELGVTEISFDYRDEHIHQSLIFLGEFEGEKVYLMWLTRKYYDNED